VNREHRRSDRLEGWMAATNSLICVAKLRFVVLPTFKPKPRKIPRKLFSMS